MKIWLLTSEFPPHLSGGIAKYVENLCKALTNSEHELTVFTRWENDEVWQYSENVRIVGFRPGYEYLASDDPDAMCALRKSFPYNVMNYWAGLSYQIALLVEKFAATEGAPEIVESQEYGGLPYFLLQRRLVTDSPLSNTPVLVHMHSAWFELAEANQEPRSKLEPYWCGQMEKFSIKAADAVLCPSQFLADRINEKLELKDPVRVIPLPLDMHGLEVRSSPKSIVDHRGAKSLMYFGRVEYRKGVSKLVKSMSRRWEKGDSTVLYLVGGDTHFYPRGSGLKTVLASKFSKYIADGRLKICEKMSWNELAQMLAQVDAVVIPSLWENFPNTCIEAMAVGCVVLGSKTGGQAEMINQPGKNGFLFDWSIDGDLDRSIDEICSLSCDERRLVGLRARERVMEYCSPTRIAKERLNHYSQVKIKPRTCFPASWNGYSLPKPTPVLGSGNSVKGLISVIVTFYNLGAYIEETLSSILSSEGVELEVVIINDGSDDVNSLQVLKSIEARNDPRIRIFSKSNAGLAAARNTGALEAKGEYIAFVDADDLINKTFLSKSKRVLESYSNVGFVYSWVQYFDNGSSVWPTWNAEFPYILAHNMLVPLVLVKREAFLSSGGNNIIFEYNFEDYECWVSMLKRGWLGVAIPEVLTLYRIRRGSMLQSANSDQFCYLYDRLSEVHSDLYAKWGPELFRLQISNGSGQKWDHPAAIPHTNNEEYLRNVEKQRDQFWERVQVLGKAWEAHVAHIEDQNKVIETLRRKGAGELDLPAVLRKEYENVVRERDAIRAVLESVQASGLSDSGTTWEQKAGATLIRKLRSYWLIRAALRVRPVYKICERYLNN